MSVRRSRAIQNHRTPQPFSLQFACIGVAMYHIDFVTHTDARKSHDIYLLFSHFGWSKMSNNNKKVYALQNYSTNNGYIIE